MLAILQTSNVVDELLSELQALKAHISNSDELGRRLSKQLSGEIENLQSKLGDLQSVQVGPSESLGEEAAAVTAKLNSKVNQLQNDVNDLKVSNITMPSILSNKPPCFFHCRISWLGLICQRW